MSLYTIGYATKSIDTFIQQLQQYKINAVADVRSVPYSKAFHDYHQESIKSRLMSSGIHYIYLGEELGPRSKDPAHYNQEGQVQFDRLMESDLFKKGVDRLHKGLQKGYRIALMCAEKDPATCHRSLLIGYALAHYYPEWDEIPIHIQHDGDIETQLELEQRLVNIQSCSVDLFNDEGAAQKQAYQEQLKKTSYIKP